MRIKKLEIIGFKSFKDRTVIHFDAGITGIVGPNGCGKSNIVDALVWVMGEMSAKHLRGSSMSDVIFAGAENFAPLGMAEVSLTLENDGGPFPTKYLKFSEVMVTRRLFRSGDSEYLINKEVARLRDVQEIFMDTGAGSKGFSIIEQGRIGEIITAKPEQRRTLIEEAAGITKFKVRKRESQRKLVQTEQNLLRIQDIIGEQKRQLDSLQRQAHRAERYRKIKTELEDKDLWLSGRSYLRIHAETETAEKIFNDAQAAELQASAELAGIEAQSHELKTVLGEKENTVQDFLLRHQSSKDKVIAKENQIREFKFEIEQAKRNKEMTGSILEKYKVRKDLFVKEQLEVESKLFGVQDEVGRTETEFNLKHEEFTFVQRRIQEADLELTNKRREMLAVSQSETQLEANKEIISENLSEKREALQNENLVREELSRKKEEFEKRRKKVYDELETEKQMQFSITRDKDLLGLNLSEVKTQLQVKTSEVGEFKETLNEVTGRLYGLEDLHNNFEGFQEGVKSVMLWQRTRAAAQLVNAQQTSADGLSTTSGDEGFRPVAELIEVPNDYELVMEAALGTKLQLLLSENHENSLSAVEYLKEQKSGRSSFLCAEGDASADGRSDENIRQENGVLSFLSDVVKIPERYRSQVMHVLSDVVIVDSIRTALRLRANYPNKTFATMDGDSLSSEGVLSGGAAESAQTGVLKRKREIKELSLKREEFAGKLTLAQLSMKKLEEQFAQLSTDLELAQQKQSEKDKQINNIEKDFERAENEVHNVNNALTKQNEACQKLTDQISEADNKIIDLESRLVDIRVRKADTEKRVEELTLELEQKRQGIDQLQEQVSLLRAQLAGKKQELEGLTQQMNRVKSSLDEVDEQLRQMTAETEKSTVSLSENQILVETAQVELERWIHETQDLEALLATAKNDFEVALNQSRDTEENVNRLLHSQNDLKSKMGESNLKLEQLRMKELFLVNQMSERYQKDLRQVALNLPQVEGEEYQIEADVEELKDKIKKIGEVNLSAIEEYEELTKRYAFLTQQVSDLDAAKEQLKRVIDKINRICSRRFKDTFDQVNERFEKVFPILFGGGQAKLILVEDIEKGEMGVDIIAQPPGKKAANVSLLSGGEKALTAVSLIFSIFLVKPSPFCLLDEVDAPLDDANVYRFNDLVKEMAKRSQIILVTHNKHTMKVNNKLYGVTQEDKGVSKMVSVSLEDAQKVLS